VTAAKKPDRLPVRRDQDGSGKKPPGKTRPDDDDDDDDDDRPRPKKQSGSNTMLIGIVLGGVARFCWASPAVPHPDAARRGRFVSDRGPSPATRPAPGAGGEAPKSANSPGGRPQAAVTCPT
jgi:hypothetical protein